MNTLLQYLHYRWNFGFTAMLFVWALAGLIWLTEHPIIDWGLVLIQLTALGLQIAVVVQNWRGKL